MAEYVTLLGAEEVARAAGRMQSAAADMQRAADTIDHSLTMLASRMEEWISRLEAVTPPPPPRERPT